MLAEQGSFVDLILLVIILGALPVAYVFARRWMKHRDRRIGAAAVPLGLAYSATDTSGNILSLPFRVLSLGQSRSVSNVLSGTWHSMPLWWFDLQYRSGRYGTILSCAETPVDATFPRFIIERGNVLGPGGNRGLDKLEVEPEFDSAVKVRSEGEAERVAALFDPLFRQWLMEVPKNFGFEVFGNQVLCFSAARRPDLIEGQLLVLEGFRGHLLRSSG